MSAYEVLSRYGTAAALKVAALAFLLLVLRLVVFPFALAALLLDRAISALNVAVAKVPTEPVRLVHVSGGTPC